MKSSFAKPAETTSAPAPAQEQAEQSSAVVPAADRTLSQPMAQADDFAGNWLREDIRLPRINLIQKTSDSDLVTKFGIGSFVLAKEVKLSDGKAPFNLTALRVAKDYIQKVEFDSGETPAVFKTPEEVIAAGGSLNYKDIKSGNFFQPRAHIQFVFAAPDKVDETEAALFPYESGGKAYAMALLTVASSAYTSVAKELATLRNTNKVMRNGLKFGNLVLTSQVRKKEAKSWSIPVVKYAGENPSELVAFFDTIT